MAKRRERNLSNLKTPLDEFGKRFKGESDRACILIGGDLLDGYLEALFKRRLLQDAKTKLFDWTGPLGTFSARITLAYGLGWITDEVRKDLDTIRDMRNDLAHSSDFDLGFNSQSIRDRCKNLRTAQAFIDGFYDQAKRTPTVAPNPLNGIWISPDAVRAMGDAFKPARMRFFVTIDFLAQHLAELPERRSVYADDDILTDVYRLGGGSGSYRSKK